jgi:hypothetical protein
MRVNRYRIGTVVGILIVGAVCADARGGFFRCENSDGSVIFTDNQATCPSARPHELRGSVQKVVSTPSPSLTRSPAAARDLAAEVEATAESSWRQRKQQKEAELENLEGKAEHLRELVTWCNRGGGLVRTDDAGLRKGVSCSGVRSEFEAVESKIASARHYLDEKLEEDCRRSGCLPGWIR